MSATSAILYAFRSYLAQEYPDVHIDPDLCEVVIGARSDGRLLCDCRVPALLNSLSPRTFAVTRREDGAGFDFEEV